jgi:hypothetical protein
MKLIAVAVMAAGLCSVFSQSNQSITAPTPETNAKPLLLEKNEGELRTRRIHSDASVPTSSQFLLKVSPKNNGSQHLVAGAEALAPGNEQAMYNTAAWEAHGAAGQRRKENRNWLPPPPPPSVKPMRPHYARAVTLNCWVPFAINAEKSASTKKT